jgi:cell division protein FtsZ
MREAQNGVPAPETRRRSLLEKLAAFGITRHDGEAAPAPAAVAPPAQVTPLQRPQALAPAEPARVQPRPQSPRQQGAPESHVRAIPRPPVSEDDHLDIPAFLRRQQN